MKKRAREKRKGEERENDRREPGDEAAAVC